MYELKKEIEDHVFENVKRGMTFEHPHERIFLSSHKISDKLAKYHVRGIIDGHVVSCRWSKRYKSWIYSINSFWDFAYWHKHGILRISKTPKKTIKSIDEGLSK